MNKLKTLIVAALTSAALCAPAYAVGPAVDWDPAYFWQAGATPTNLPAGGILKAVGQVSQFGFPLLDLNANMPAKEYTFVLDGLVSQGTTVVGPLSTQFYVTNYTGGTISIYEDPTPESVFAPNPPNALVPSTFQDQGLPILTGNFTRMQVTTNNFTAFQSGSIEGDINWTGGTLIERFRGGSGAICPGLFTGGATWSTLPNIGIPGYLFRHDGKIDLQCPVPTTKNTWGQLKTLYR